MSDFNLDPRLATDTVFAADWTLCRVLLMDDARYPWLVLVPRRPYVTEFFHLASPDRAALMEETVQASGIVARLSGITKINVGALGNLVPQLHVHVVGRKPGDAAWPHPVWGWGPREPYFPEARARLIALVSSR